ncbi:toxin glutamine deamidase domain-containing protein [Nocardia cyriacigeorgica]|uniref:toxin glutamine deamidase domain-containing protein n=1 Tax=Nocardia cyriacigeorgica TaxID=135487 RepID=UPI0024558E4F|nr:toxin glutamine deamidase domain-containing protein [Nocardia cyriacigeorgica]
MATVRVHLVQGTDVTPGDLQRLMANTEQAVDHSFNITPQLLGGDRLLIDVQFTSDPANAHIQAGTRQGIGDLHTWSVNNTPVNVADNIRLQLGLYPGRDTLEGFSSEELRQLTNEIARARSRFDFDSPADMRISGPAELRPVEQPSYQHDVEDALRTGSDFAVGADPRTHPYGRLINDGGTSVQGRSNNCMDCSLSALSSFYGNPQVSAPRFPDITEDGTIDDSDGERSGDQRARAWLGSNWQRFDRNMSIADQAAAMHDYIARMGPGSSALVGNDWHSRDEDGNFEYDENGNPVDDGGHVTVIVYPYGADGPVWWDPQTGETSDGPPAELTNESYLIEFIPIGPGGPNHAGTAIDTGTSTPASSPSTGDKSGVLSSPDRVRMGMPSDSDTGGTGDGQRTRTGELRGQSSDRSDNSTSEPFRDEDRESVRRSDPDGPASTGSPGIPAHLAGTDRPDAGDLGRHPVPGSNRVPGASAGDSADGAPAHDRQTYIPPLHGQPDNPSRVHPGDGMGSSSESAERDLAAQRDLRVLDVSEFAHDNESAQSGPDSASQHDADQDKSDVATEQHAPLLDVKGYIAEPQVVEALDRADALGTTATVDGFEMPVSEAVRRLLPQHPELARLMQEADYLENSLLSRPRTLVSLMNHPEAIHVLEDAVHEVRDRGPEEVIAESESATGPDSTPLTPDQRAISDGLQAATRDFEDEDLRQPGFDRDQINDPAYVSEYLDRQYAQWRSTQDALNDVVRQVAQETSGDPGWRNEPKDRVRAEDKISGYGNDASKLTDLVGAKIVFDTVSDIYRAAELLANDERIEIVDFEDRFAEPVGSGYRDLQMKVRMPNGHIAELRLHLSHIDDVASYEHSLYEARRDLKSLARADGRDLTPSEAALMASLERRSVEMFQTALERGL